MQNQNKTINKHIRPETAVHILNMLDDKVDELTREVSVLNSYSSVLSREIFYIESELEEFLMLYYEKFSEMVMSNPKYKLPDIRTIDNHLEEAKIFDDKDCNITLFDSRLKAKNDELKKIYGLLATELNPDVNTTLVAKFLSSHIKRLHDEGNVDELNYIKIKIEKGRELEGKTALEKIDMLEGDIKISRLRKNSLEAKKEQIINSCEYQLYRKYKIAQMRGEDFFKLLLESYA